MSEQTVTPTIEEYKGHELLVLNPDNKWPLKFGLQKAKLILAHVEDIASFIEDQEAKQAKD